MVGLDTDPLRAGASIPPNANVLIQPTFFLPLDFVGGVVEGVIKQLPGVTGDVTKESITLPAGNAIRFTFQLVARPPRARHRPGTPPDVPVDARRQRYLVTFVTLSDQVARDTPAFDQIIDTFALHLLAAGRLPLRCWAARVHSGDGRAAHRRGDGPGGLRAIPPCADARFDHRTCDYWEDADRGSKEARVSWLAAAPPSTAARAPRPGLVDNPFAPPPKNEFGPRSRCWPAA